MKTIAFVAVSLATLALLDITSAFIVSPPVAPFLPGGMFAPGLFGPLGPMGLGAFGGLGLGLGGLGLGLGGFGLGGLGLGLGGFGLGSFGPLGGLGPFGRARLGGIRGRRAIDDQLHGIGKPHGDISCEISKELLNCTGPHEIIQCALEAHSPVQIEKTHFKMFDFTFKEKTFNNIELLKVVPKKLSHRLGHKINHVSIYSNSTLTETETGFLVKDPICFDEIVSLVKQLPEKFKVTFHETD
jgi:hypothetical protein